MLGKSALRVGWRLRSWRGRACPWVNLMLTSCPLLTPISRGTRPVAPVVRSIYDFKWPNIQVIFSSFLQEGRASASAQEKALLEEKERLKGGLAAALKQSAELEARLAAAAAELQQVRQAFFLPIQFWHG